MTKYTKDEAALIKRLSTESDKALDSVTIKQAGPTDNIVPALQSLLAVVESGLKIAYARHYGGETEPFPGACKAVMEQSIKAIAIARASGILPEREK